MALLSDDPVCSGQKTFDTLTVFYWMSLESRGCEFRLCICCSLPYLPLLSNLMIWAALNAFPFGLITLWEDQPHVRREPAISPPWPLGKTAVSFWVYIWVCVCVSVQYLCMSSSWTHTYKETHIFLPAWATTIKIRVLSFHSGSEQGIKSTGHSTRFGPFI